MTLRFARWAAVSTREQAKPGKRSITSLQGEDLPHWLSHHDPGEVNHTLKSIIHEIIIGDEIRIVMK